MRKKVIHSTQHGLEGYWTIDDIEERKTIKLYKNGNVKVFAIIRKKCEGGAVVIKNSNNTLWFDKCDCGCCIGT